jgi:PAS domain S-box-containing protein
MARALQTGTEFNEREIIFERPDGQRRTVLAHVSPLRDDSGKVSGAVNVLLDITDRKRAEKV